MRVPLLSFVAVGVLVVSMLLQTAPVEATHGYFAPWPANIGYYVTQPPGDLQTCPGGSHCSQPDYYAYDFSLVDGNITVASHSGQVIRFNLGNSVGGCSSTFANYANYIVLDRGNGYSTGYWHLQYRSEFVSPYDFVMRAQQLARADSTGWVCGAHLHFFLMTTPPEGQIFTNSVWLHFDDIGRPPGGAFVISGNSN